jgi:hypothetical protein
VTLLSNPLRFNQPLFYPCRHHYLSLGVCACRCSRVSVCWLAVDLKGESHELLVSGVDFSCCEDRRKSLGWMVTHLKVG